MCIICVDFQRQRMTLRDAQRAYGEMKAGLGPEHAKEVEEMLDEASKTTKPDEKLQDPQDP